MRKAAILKLAAVLLLVGAGVAAIVNLPVIKEYFRDFLEWTKEIGYWGPVLIGAVYIPACIFFIPGWILTMGAGLVAGLWWGTAAVSVGSVTGASICFFLGRTLMRSWVEGRVSKNAKFQAIDQAVGSSGFKIVLLTRLSPVFPFNLLNYAYGLTKVRFRDYLLASWIGMLPGTFLYVYLGTTAKDLAAIIADEFEGGMGQIILLGAGLLATIVVTVVITRVARKAIREAVPEGATSEPPPAPSPAE